MKYGKKTKKLTHLHYHLLELRDILIEFTHENISSLGWEYRFWSELNTSSDLHSYFLEFFLIFSEVISLFWEKCFQWLEWLDYISSERVYIFFAIEEISFIGFLFWFIIKKLRYSYHSFSYWFLQFSGHRLPTHRACTGYRSSQWQYRLTDSVLSRVLPDLWHWGL